jgi:hypothetical protein
VTDPPPITDDPWIDAYLKCRAAILGGEIQTLRDVEEFAHELRRGLPRTAPSVPAATFITADIDITFPESSHLEYRDLMVGLWRPDFARPAIRRVSSLIIEGEI